MLSANGDKHRKTAEVSHRTYAFQRRVVLYSVRDESLSKFNESYFDLRADFLYGYYRRIIAIFLCKN